MSQLHRAPTQPGAPSIAVSPRRVGYSRGARTALRTMAYLQFLAFILTLLSAPAQLPAQSARQVIVISIDGMTPTSTLTGPLLTTPTNKGTHGYNPAIREMHPSFILYGAGITPCESPPDVKIFDVGPTAAALLGVSMKGTQGTAVDHIQAASPKQ